MTRTPPALLLTEALVVALTFVVLFFVVHIAAMRLVGDGAMTDHSYLALQVALAAGGFHVGCEYLGVNAWYCDQHRKKGL